MSKAEQILSNTSRASRRKQGFLGQRGRFALLSLTVLLLLFVFFTQPDVRAALTSWTSLISG
ncbi:hypothetical protein [Ruegeria arenilitoris]|uniref:hypothetical protein n=1 Tax=Ruegeria arenilitoris TaxID=1173585 RepID=UPI00147B4BEC|nr:hypothetical protein [Ruegeria arenilitoris]